MSAVLSHQAPAQTDVGARAGLDAVVAGELVYVEQVRVVEDEAPTLFPVRDLAPDLTLAGIGDLVDYAAAEFRDRRFHRQGTCPAE